MKLFFRLTLIILFAVTWITAYFSSIGTAEFIEVGATLGWVWALYFVVFEIARWGKK